MAEARELRVEATGETVGEAKWHALRELEQRLPGLDRASVRFQVVSEGERGLLGVGYEPARVVAVADADAPPAPPPPRVLGAERAGEAAGAAAELVARIAAGLGVPCSVEVAEAGGVVHVTCSGEDLGLLIGRHGQTIDAVQYLANAAVRRLAPDGAPEVVVDAAGYRDRRRAALEALADRAADRALATASPVPLEPMSPVERKAVHAYLAARGDVATASEGAEPHRHVVVSPGG